MSKYKNEIFKMSIGCILYSLSVVLFLNPVKLIPGSVTGIGVVVNHLYNFPIGLLSVIINIPLMIIALFYLGKKFLLYTGYTIMLTSILIDALSFLPVFSHDLMLDSIFGGVVMGVGLGLILDAGASTGGTTIIGRLITRKYPSVQIGNILLIIDFIIIIGGTIAFKDADIALYSIINLYICVIVINKVMYGFKINNIAIITTKHIKKVELAIMDYFPHIKVNTVPNQGNIDNGELIICICKKNENSKLQRLVLKEDPSAFCTTVDIDYSFGKILESVERKDKDLLADSY